MRELILCLALGVFAVAAAGELVPVGVSARLGVVPVTSNARELVLLDLDLLPVPGGLQVPFDALDRLNVTAELGLDAAALRSSSAPFLSAPLRFFATSRLEIDMQGIPETVKSLAGRLVYEDKATGALMEVASFSVALPRARPGDGEACVKTSFDDGRLRFDPPAPRARLPTLPFLAEVPLAAAAAPRLAASAGLNAVLLRLPSDSAAGARACSRLCRVASDVPPADVSLALAAMDAAADAGVGVLLSVDFAPSNFSTFSSDLVPRFRGRPALLGWLSGDNVRAALVSSDPCHPTLRPVSAFDSPAVLFDAGASTRAPLLLTAGPESGLRGYTERLAVAVDAFPPRTPFWAEIPVPPVQEGVKPDAGLWLAKAASALVAGATGVYASGSPDSAAAAAALGPAIAEAVAAGGPALSHGARAACGTTGGDCVWGPEAGPGLLAAAWRYPPDGAARPGYLVIAMNPSDAPARLSVSLPALGSDSSPRPLCSAGRLDPTTLEWAWEDVPLEGYTISDPRPLAPGEVRAYSVPPEGERPGAGGAPGATPSPTPPAPSPYPSPAPAPEGPGSEKREPPAPPAPSPPRHSGVAIFFFVLAVATAAAAAAPLALRLWRAYRNRAVGYHPIRFDERSALYPEPQSPLSPVSP
eukprot:tig00020563_g11251.t1